MRGNMATDPHITHVNLRPAARRPVAPMQAVSRERTGVSLLLFAAALSLFWATRTQYNTFDAVSYANQIGALVSPHPRPALAVPSSPSVIQCDRLWRVAPGTAIRLSWRAPGRPGKPECCPGRRRYRAVLSHPAAFDAAVALAAIDYGSRTGSDLWVLGDRDRWASQHASDGASFRGILHAVHAFGQPPVPGGRLCWDCWQGWPCCSMKAQGCSCLWAL